MTFRSVGLFSLSPFCLANNLVLFHLLVHLIPHYSQGRKNGIALKLDLTREAQRDLLTRSSSSFSETFLLPLPRFFFGSPLMEFSPRGIFSRGFEVQIERQGRSRQRSERGNQWSTSYSWNILESWHQRWLVQDSRTGSSLSLEYVSKWRTWDWNDMSWQKWFVVNGYVSSTEQWQIAISHSKSVLTNGCPVPPVIRKSHET